MEKNLEKIVSWAKRRGFVMPGSEIYGGLSGIYDFGPYGVTFKNNLKKLWWKKFVEDRDDIVGLESAILMNRQVWQASGHEKDFIDKLVECKKCHQRFKADDLPKEKCSAGGEHEFTEARQFNPMFKTNVGVIENDESMTYLRPETAQGMLTDFKQVMEISRQKLPFGIAQIGKSFRNEINTKDFLFRVREFEIAEIEYFVKKGDDEKAFDEWLKDWEEFVLSIGIKKESIEHHEHPKESLAHYSKRTVDILYNFPFGKKELAGVANRTDFDLSSHEKASGKDLKFFDEETKEKILPYVVEPTLGIERLMLAIICDAFEEISGGRGEPEEKSESGEIILHLEPKLAPVKVAVLPLVKKLSDKAQEIYQDLKTCWGEIEYDESGSIGRRYRRQDEIGTPFCVTIDFEKDNKVTVRDRDTMKQERVAIKELKNYLFGKLGSF
ncbi:MAG: glycine--tRNA ligase [Patescibacteria group bacterium]